MNFWMFLLSLTRYDSLVKSSRAILILPQVCLAGVAPETGETFSEKECLIFSSLLAELLVYPEDKVIVTFLGQLEGGRWLVNLNTDGEDLSHLLVDEEVLAAAALPAITPLEEARENTDVVELSAPVVSKIILSELETAEGGVCYCERPDMFYLCPAGNIDLISNMFLRSQSVALSSPLEVVSGTCCMIKMEENLFRAEIRSVSPDGKRARVFMIDYGMSLEPSLTDLFKLPKELSSVPGLVVRVHLRGIKPAGSEWSDQEMEAAKIILDVEGSTNFALTDIKYVAGECWVNMTDPQGRDVAELFIKTGAAVLDTLQGELEHP